MFRVRDTYSAGEYLEDDVKREDIDSSSSTTIRKQRKNFRWLKTGILFQFSLLVLLAIFLHGTRLEAQTGLISGTVVDPSGASIPGAQVQIINQATGDVTRNAVADGNGNFRALNIPAGPYKFKVTSPGSK